MANEDGNKGILNITSIESTAHLTSAQWEAKEDARVRDSFFAAETFLDELGWKYTSQSDALIKMIARAVDAGPYGDPDDFDENMYMFLAGVIWAKRGGDLSCHTRAAEIAERAAEKAVRRIKEQIVLRTV